MTHTNLIKLFSETQDEIMSQQELIDNCKTAGISNSEMEIMEAAISEHPQYINGLPFPGDDAAYDMLVKSNTGIALIQKYMDFWG